MKLKRADSLKAVIQVPGDKSISHRALIFGAIAEGDTRIENLLKSGDVMSTKKCLEKMGVNIEQNGETFIVHGRGKNSLRSPTTNLECENSGTTMRLLMGLVAGANLDATLTGDESLSRRPMKRIAEPLLEMGAHVQLSDDDFAPVYLTGAGPLRGGRVELKIASAQLKSALLLAGLYGQTDLSLTGKILSRDHTEKMLKDFGVEIKCSADEICLPRNQNLKATRVSVPGDPSSAAFWLAAGAIVRNSAIEICGVSLNPTRTGFLEVLKRMGARLEILERKKEGEPSGDIKIYSSELKATDIHEHEISSLIDEVPIFAILASQAKGISTVRGARELRVKESDRIEAIASNLRRMGAKIETFEDGFRIEGPQQLTGCKIETHHDHRIAMSFSIAALIAEGETEIDGVDSVSISYPGFYEQLRSVT